MFDIPHDQLGRNKQLSEVSGSWTKVKPIDPREIIVYRQWGSYKVLHEGEGYTVKELTILPGKSLSDQRHFNRDEHWFVVKGTLNIDLQEEKRFNAYKYDVLLQASDDHTLANWTILRKTWHRPYNDGVEPVVVIETWIGNSSEEDIERRNQ